MKFYIREARERIGLSQKDLAAQLGIKPSTFNGYETGAHDPKSELLVKIAKKCGTSVDYLLGIEQIKKAPEAEKPATEAEIQETMIIL